MHSHARAARPHREHQHPVLAGGLGDGNAQAAHASVGCLCAVRERRNGHVRVLGPPGVLGVGIDIRGSCKRGQSGGSRRDEEPCVRGLVEVWVWETRVRETCGGAACNRALLHTHTHTCGRGSKPRWRQTALADVPACNQGVVTKKQARRRYVKSRSIRCGEAGCPSRSLVIQSYARVVCTHTCPCLKGRRQQRRRCGHRLRHRCREEHDQERRPV